MFNLPPSFFIVACSFLIWIVVLALTRSSGSRSTR
jgi:hypothetical protein